MKCGGFFALLFVVLSIALFGSSSASAVSIFDDTVQITDEIILKSNVPGGEAISMTTEWLTEIETQCGGTTSAFVENIVNSPNGKYGLTYYELPPSHPDYPMTQFWFNGTTAEGAEAEFVDTGIPTATYLFVPSSYKLRMYIYDDVVYCDSGATPYLSSSPGHWELQGNGASIKVFANTYPVQYPDGYAGAEVPGQFVPGEILKPDYSWTVKKNGDLNISYLKNLPHFLTGTSTFNVDKMNNNWDGIESSVAVLDATPAGWADVVTQLPSEGYYMVRVNHNQQLDEPPWPEDNNYRIGEMLFQFYWDGNSFMQGDTVGCEVGQLCNEDRKPANSWFDGIKFPTYGLQEVVLAPLNFWATLPGATANCQPIILNMPYLNRNISLPCLTTTVYQPNFNSLLVIWQTIMTGLVAYWVSIRIFSTIKNVDSPNNDRIEVAQL